MTHSLFNRLQPSECHRDKTRSFVACLIAFSVVVYAFFASCSAFAQGGIKWPKEDDLVFQRMTGNQANANFGFIDLYGYFDQSVTNIKVTFETIPVPYNAGVSRFELPLSNEGYEGRPQPWRYEAYPNFVSTSSSGKINFVSTYKLSPGYYTIRVSGQLANGQSTSLPTRRIGIGDVYLIAGQSNAAGDTRVPLNAGYYDNAGGMLQYHNEKSDFDCNDPGAASVARNDPNSCRPASTKNYPWYWLRLGQKLLQTQQVPIAFYQAAWSGTSVNQWNNGFTGSSYPYQNFDEALKKQVLMYGLRGVLWMQGELDTQQGTSQGNYAQSLTAVINKSRNTLAGSEYSRLPWIIARTSWNGTQSSTAVIAGQNQVINNTTYVYAGPSTDDLTGAGNRLNDPANGDVNVHFADNALDEVAQRWKDAILNSGFQNSFNYINEQAMAIEYGSGRLSAEYLTGAVTSSFVWNNRNTGETRTGTKYIDNSGPGLWITSFQLPDGRTCQTSGYYVEGATTSPCTFSNPVRVGSWNGYTVQIRQYGGKVVLVVVTDASNDTHFPRGDNFWDAVQRDGGVDSYRTCLNGGDTGYGGLAFPNGVTAPAGYVDGYSSDGAHYFVRSGTPPPPPNNPCTFNNPVRIGSWNGYTVQIRQFSNKVALVVVTDGASDTHFPRGDNFWDAVQRDGGVDSHRSCLNAGDTGYGGLVFPGGVTTPAGYTDGYTSDGAHYFTRFGGPNPPSTSGNCSASNDQCSGNSSEQATYTSSANAGSQSVYVTYRSHEGPGIINVNVNGQQTQVNVDQTGVNEYRSKLLGNFSVSNNNTIVLSSGQSFVCFRQVCIGSPSGRVSVMGEEPSAVTMSVFPNPAIDKVTVRYYQKADGPAQLRLSSFSGHTILQREYAGKAGINDVDIDLKESAIGAKFILVELETDRQHVVRKLIRQ